VDSQPNFQRMIEKKIGGGDDIGSNQFRYDCPFCGDESGHLFINYDKNVFICHRGRCGIKGHLRQLIRKMRISQWDYSDEPLLTRSFFRKKIRDTRMEYAGSLLPLSPHDPQFQYLIQRGISAEIIYSNLIYKSSYSSRIYFVETNEKNEVINWVARRIDAKKFKKYRMAMNGDRSVPYRYSLVDPSKPLHICEGPISTLAADDNAISLYGCVFTRPQIVKIAALGCDRIYVSLDGEAEGFGLKLADALQGYCGDVRIVNLPMGEDPASLGRNVYQQYVDFAKPVTSFYSLRRRIQKCSF